MTIQYCSDLHLEFLGNRQWLKENPLIPSGEVLIIAGDCFHLGDDYESYDFIQQISDEFEAVYILLGNHEYYGGFDAATALEATYEPIKENVFIVNNISIEAQGIRLIFSTMWSLIDRNILEVMRGMMDFRQIRFGGERFTINHFNALHKRSFQFLEEEVAKPGKKMVITHHLPSNECNIDLFKGSVLNPAFCVEKTWLFIAHSDISHWIYGHSHQNKADFDINGTTMVTNQLGYVGSGEHQTFVRDKVIEI